MLTLLLLVLISLGDCTKIRTVPEYAAPGSTLEIHLQQCSPFDRLFLEWDNGSRTCLWSNSNQNKEYLASVLVEEAFEWVKVQVIGEESAEIVVFKCEVLLEARVGVRDLVEISVLSSRECFIDAFWVKSRCEIGQLERLGEALESKSGQVSVYSFQLEAKFVLSLEPVWIEAVWKGQKIPHAVEIDLSLVEIEHFLPVLEVREGFFCVVACGELCSGLKLIDLMLFADGKCIYSADELCELKDSVCLADVVEFREAVLMFAVEFVGSVRPAIEVQRALKAEEGEDKTGSSSENGEESVSEDGEESSSEDGEANVNSSSQSAVEEERKNEKLVTLAEEERVTEKRVLSAQKKKVIEERTSLAEKEGTIQSPFAEKESTSQRRLAEKFKPDLHQVNSLLKQDSNQKGNSTLSKGTSSPSASRIPQQNPASLVKKAVKTIEIPLNAPEKELTNGLSSSASLTKTKSSAAPKSVLNSQSSARVESTEQSENSLKGKSAIQSESIAIQKESCPVQTESSLSQSESSAVKKEASAIQKESCAVQTESILSQKESSAVQTKPQTALQTKSQSTTAVQTICDSQSESRTLHSNNSQSKVSSESRECSQSKLNSQSQSHSRGSSFTHSQSCSQSKGCSQSQNCSLTQSQGLSRTQSTPHCQSQGRSLTQSIPQSQSQSPNQSTPISPSHSDPLPPIKINGSLFYPLQKIDIQLIQPPPFPMFNLKLIVQSQSGKSLTLITWNKLTSAHIFTWSIPCTWNNVGRCTIKLQCPEMQDSTVDFKIGYSGLCESNNCSSTNLFSQKKEHSRVKCSKSKSIKIKVRPRIKVHLKRKPKHSSSDEFIFVSSAQRLESKIQSFLVVLLLLIVTKLY